MNEDSYRGPVRVAKVADAIASRLTLALRPVALPALRIALGLLFIWFGGLKLAGVSPVAAIVAGTLPWADPQVAVPVLGAAELALGAVMMTGFAARVVLPLLAAHLSGTFLALVMLPGLMFNGNNPLLLTESGEFVMKNLVLLGATLVLLTHAPAAKSGHVARTAALHADTGTALIPQRPAAMADQEAAKAGLVVTAGERHAAVPDLLDA
jgi:putative oxidoreductase